VHFRGTVHRVGGNGFCGCSRRALLMLLQERARELGVALHFETEIADDSDPRIAGADLVVLSDGINSRFREKYSEHFAPEVDLRSNVFAWMAPQNRSMPLPSFSRRPSGARSSRMPINMRRAARPGFSRPIRDLCARRPDGIERAAVSRPHG